MSKLITDHWPEPLPWITLKYVFKKKCIGSIKKFA